MASNIEVKAAGTGRSLDEEEEDRREEPDVLDGVRERASRRTGVREPRFGGITTGVELADP